MANSAVTTSTAALESELASLVRVRNRLAQTPDSTLPRILSKLLPRLLVKLEGTYQQVIFETQDGGTTTNSKLEAQIRGHLMGILMHALERIRGNVEMDVRPWISVVATSLESSTSRVVRMVILSFLQTAIPRCCSSRPESIPMATLLKAVDQCYARCCCEEEVSVSEASQLELRTVSWLLLDAIAVVSGLEPMVDWDLDCYNGQGRLGVYEPPKEAAETIPLATHDSIDSVCQDGTGVFDLMLDVLLFWPSPPPRRQWPLHNNRATEDATSGGGISVNGRRRMTFRLKERTWNDMTQGYLRCIKTACFDFCVSKEHSCIFQGDKGSIGATRALVLSVLLANTNSIVGRQANDYLSIHFSESIPSSGTPQQRQQQADCSLSMSCSLLLLVLGDAASAPIVEQYSSQQHLWVSLLGRRPLENTAMRSPLSPSVSARVIDFISNRLVIPSFRGSIDSMNFFVDLAAAVQKNRLEDGLWAIRLIYGLYKQVAQMENDGWLDNFRTKCLLCATDTLAGMPDPQLNTRATSRVDATVPMNRAIARRRAENELFINHRRALRKKRLRFDDAIRARENAYELISCIGSCDGRSTFQNSETNELSFDLPNILFKCAVLEDTMMKPRATQALSELLSSFKSDVAGDDGISRTCLERKAAHLIPSLVDAACCESEAVRLISARWSSELIATIDPPAAYCLCEFLANDPDGRVSHVAKTGVDKVATDSLTQCHDSRHAMWEYLDLSTDRDRETLTLEAEARIAFMAKKLSIPTSAASAILSSFEGSSQKALDACVMDRDAVLEQCGVKVRCDVSTFGSPAATSPVDVCGICYDDLIPPSHSYAMACGHRFCRTCWKSYIQSKLDEGPSQILNATCPKQECAERVTGVEIHDLAPRNVAKWKEYFIRQFVDQEKRYRFCPGPDCDVVVVALGDGDTGPVECICGTSFCFGCGEAPHVPALCADFEKWQSIFGSSEFWVAKNSKPCPNCNVPIEKNQGCNHMKCSQCQHDFCWICLARLDTHLMAHTCNQYNPADHTENDDEKMRLFFTDRFQAHEEAEQFAKKRLEGIDDKVQHLLDKFWLLGEEDAEELVSAEETLVAARGFLKNSYVAVYGMKDDTSHRTMFESHQGALELLTETLSGLTEVNVDNIYVDGGEHGLSLYLRAISFYPSIVRRYMNRVANLQTNRASKA